jgi:hypothetical protein
MTDPATHFEMVRFGAGLVGIDPIRGRPPAGAYGISLRRAFSSDSTEVRAFSSMLSS